MAKMHERKYGPKARTKDRDKSAQRFVARKAKFGDTPRVPAGGGSYVPKRASTFSAPKKTYSPRAGNTNAPARPTATGYVKGGATQRAYTPRTTTPAPMGHTSKKVYAPSTFKKSTSWSKSSNPGGPLGKVGYVPKKPIYKSVTPNNPRTASASWGEVASWYDKHLNEADTYHEKVLLPNLLRLVDAKKGEHILELACGQGYFTRAIAKTGAHVEGIDIAPELIAIAQKESPTIPYHVGSADDLSHFADASQDKVLISLAIQNIENIEGVVSEAWRILKPAGEFHIAMNHPAFRIPKQSSWAYDDKQKVQTRRVDQYLSNSKTDIDMHPGFADAPKTISYHRPLQFYFKVFAKHGFAVTRLEEWISHKTSDSGPRAKAENNARKEIPLFLYLKVVKQ